MLRKTGPAGRKELGSVLQVEVTPVRKQKRPVWQQQQKEEWQDGRLGKRMRPR